MCETSQLNGMFSVVCTIWWGRLPSIQPMNWVPSLLSFHLPVPPPLPVFRSSNMSRLFLDLCRWRGSTPLRYPWRRRSLRLSPLLTLTPGRSLSLRAWGGGRRGWRIRVGGWSRAVCSATGSCFDASTCQTDTFLPVSRIPCLQFARLAAVENLFTPRAGRQANSYRAPALVTVSKAVLHHLLALLQSLSRQCRNTHMVSGLGHRNT